MSNVLTDRLENVRRRIRGEAWRRGAFWLAVAGLGAVLAACFADAVFHVSGGMRVLFLGAVATAVGYAGFRYLYLPLRTNVDDLDIALRWEKLHPDTAEEISGAYEFLKQPSGDPTAGSLELRQRVIASGLEKASAIDPERMLTTLPTRQAGWWAVGAGVAAGVAFFAAPDTAKLALTRLFDPFGAHPWPKRTRIELVDPKTRVAKGDAFPVAVRITGVTPDRVKLSFKFADGRAPIVEDMRQESDADFRGALDAAAVGFAYSIEAGDDRIDWQDVQVNPVPEELGVRLKVSFPKYTRLPDEEYPEGRTTVRAVVGSTVTLVAAANKPLQSAQLQWDKGAAAPMTVGADKLALAAQFKVEKDSKFRMVLTDEEGVSNVDRTPKYYSVQALPDRAPDVTLEKPAADGEATEKALVPIKALVKDDFGLSGADLVFTVAPPGFATGQKLPENRVRLAEATNSPNRLVGDLQWNLEPLKLKSGSVITLHVEATDLCDAPRPNVGKSKEIRLRVVTRDELIAAVEGKQQRLREELQRTNQMQQNALKQTTDVQRQAENVGNLRAEDRDLLSTAETNQRNVRSRIADPDQGLSRQAEDLLSELTNNRISDVNSTRRLGFVKAELGRLTEQQLPAAAQALTQARKDADAQDSPGGAQKSPNQDGAKGQNGKSAAKSAKSGQSDKGKDAKSAAGAENAAEAKSGDAQSSDEQSADGKSNEQGNASGKQPGSKQSGSKQSGGKQSGGKQSGKQSGGKQSDGKQSQSGGEQSAEAQSSDSNPSQESGGEQSQAGGKQSPSGGKQSGGKQSGGKQSGGKQSDGGKQSGGQQSQGKQGGEQSDGKQGGEQAGAEQEQPAEKGLAGELQQARKNQEKVVDALENMLAQLGEWETSSQAAADARAMMRQQAEASNRLQDVAPKVVGKEAKELDGEEKASIEQAADRQENVRASLNKLENLIGRLAEKFANEDPAGAAAMKEALARSQQANLGGKMNDAANQIRNNRVNEAQSNQQQIQAAIANMVEAVENRREMELALLVKQMKEAEKAGRDLAEQQRLLRKRTQDAQKMQDPGAREEELRKLAKRQQELERQAEDLARKLSKMQSQTASRRTGRSASRMNQAGSKMQQGQGEQAGEQQEQALAELNDAMEQLAQDRQEKEEQLHQEQLARIADNIRALFERQIGVGEELARLTEAKQKKGALTRGQQQSVLGLGRTESGLSDETKQLTQKLPDAKVFALVLEQAAGRMAAAAEKFGRRDVGPTAKADVDAAARRLLQLLESLKADNEGGGQQGGGQQQGGEQQGGEQRQNDGIPGAAQIKLLIALQAEIRENTTELLNTKAKEGGWTPEQQKLFTDLGERQGRLADLVDDLVEKAKRRRAGAQKSDEGDEK